MITDRIDAITKIGPERLHAVVPTPKAVKIELTARCNLKCGFCAHRLRKHASGEMDPGFFGRILHEMVAGGVSELGFFFIGESMLCSWLPDAIRIAKKAGIKYTFLTTNGVAATPLKLRAVMEAGLDSLKWSFNHANAAQFAQLTGTPGKGFAKMIANIKAASEIRAHGGFSTKLYASSIKYNGEQGDKMVAAVSQILPYVDQHYWLPLYSFGDQATAREGELGYKPSAGNQGRLDCLRKPLPCWTIFTEGHITWDGKLSACCFDVGDTWEMADLNKMSFEKAWNSEQFQTIRKAHLKEDVRGTPCEHCAVGN